MRTEQEMMELILSVAAADERVRAVAMNGSRTNANAPKDRFQDYDIVYLVDDIEPYLREPEWIDVFGERIVMQTPDDNALFPPERESRYAYLMLFADGNRIDLTLIPASESDAYLAEDKLTVVLMDKDGRLPALPPPSDEDYRVRRPGPEHFRGCCNEFWWVSPYVAKGAWRREMLYATEHLDIVRDMLLKMLEWRVGWDTEFRVSIGKSYKYLERYVSEDVWRRLMRTFPDGTYEGVWAALYEMGDLFRETAREVAGLMNFVYDEEEDRRVCEYLRRVESMGRE
ncbi:aminoglycoside 6-adenylyltransferase [Paenibacillus antri]|uniref:Aminoglycoside 6-adenylyltransferase n=1 Tax=Paenibacillus antri TaxID=2582848 RepID=A0A5R9G2X9_9BACL|nr:aminoglycoside 6-adenylyltransferase [Paenibacillus antri]TLS50712.1 aminoglycoside 6-adenylyltransferase [Paenibacillus antri]